MLSRFLDRWRHPPRLTWADALLTLLPAAIWLAGVYGRSTFIAPRCAQDPALCARQGVLGIDQPALGRGDKVADHFSFMTQNLSGYLAAAVPIAWNGGLAIAGRLTPAGAVAAAGVDLLISVQAIAWNGAVNESARLLVQRPRPFVYADPARLGGDPANYTSFYSGHTSFSATAGAACFFGLVGRGAPGIVLALAGTVATALAALTGMFRVLAGRHFLTDVIVGALAGLLIASIVALLHRRRA